MAKMNKPVDLDINGFMHQMRTNKPSEKKDVQDVKDTTIPLPDESIGLPTTPNVAAVEVEMPSPEQEVIKRGKGRPPKRSIRNQRLIFKTDKETFVRLGRVKFEEKFDLQDIIHLAVIRFLDDNFKKDGSAVSDDIRQKIKDDLSKYEIPAEGKK